MIQVSTRAKLAGVAGLALGSEAVSGICGAEVPSKGAKPDNARKKFDADGFPGTTSGPVRPTFHVLMLNCTN